MSIRRFLCVLALVACALSPAAASAAEERQQVAAAVSAIHHDGLMTFRVDHPDVASIRVQVFDAGTGATLYDSGPFAGTMVTWPVDGAGDGRWRYLVHAWDAGGALVTTQSALAPSQVTIASIAFDTVPAAANLIAAPIALQGDVLVGTGTTTASVHVRTAIGDSVLTIEADTDNNNEADNPALILRQDGNLANALIALEGLGGTISPGTLSNSLVIGSEDNDPAVQVVTNDLLRATFGTDGLTTLYHGLGAGDTEGVRIENNGGGNNVDWTLYATNGDGNLELYYEGALRGEFSSGTGAYSSVSDRALKRDVAALGPVLDRVMGLRPATYRLVSAPPEAPRSLGLVAQEARPLFPELVTPISREDGSPLHTVDYAGFAVVAIAAIQEQQRIIEDLRERVEELEARR